VGAVPRGRLSAAPSGGRGSSHAPRLYIDPEWMADPVRDERGRALDLDLLPMGAGLRSDLRAWARWWERLADALVLDRQEPAPHETARFRAEELDLWRRLREELGESHEVGLIGPPRWRGPVREALVFDPDELEALPAPAPGERIFRATRPGLPGPLWREATGVMIDLDRLPLEPETRAAVRGWAAACEEVAYAGRPPTKRGWKALEAEGRRLWRRLHDELRGRHEVGHVGAFPGYPAAGPDPPFEVEWPGQGGAGT
jgi:hypothetical protein